MLLLLLLLLLGTFAGAFELRPVAGSIRLYDDATSFTLRGLGLNTTSRLTLYPEFLNDMVLQTVNVDEQTLTLQLAAPNITSWLNGSHSNLNDPSLSIFARLAKAKVLLLAKVFPKPALFPAQSVVRESSVHFLGRNLDAATVGALEFSRPMDSFEFTMNSTCITIYFVEPTTSSSQDASPISLLAMSGPAGRVTIQDVSFLPPTTTTKTGRIIIPPASRLPELYNTGADVLHLQGEDLDESLVVEFAHSNTVQYRDVDMVFESSTRLALYPKPSTFVQWMDWDGNNQASKRELVVKRVNGITTHLPVALLREMPIILRNLNQVVCAHERVRVFGFGFVAHETLIQLSIVDVHYVQTVDFDIYVVSRIELEVHWKNQTQIALAAAAATATTSTASSTAPIRLKWIQIGRAPRIHVNMEIASLLPSATLAVYEHQPHERIFQTLSRTISIQLANRVVKALGPSTTSCEVVLASRGRLLKTHRFPKAPMNKTGLIVLTMPAKMMQGSGWQLGGLHLMSLKANAAQRWGASNSQLQTFGPRGVQIGIVRPDITVNASDLVFCRSKLDASTFSIIASGVTLQSKFEFTPADFQVEPNFVVSNNRVTFTRKPRGEAVWEDGDEGEEEQDFPAGERVMIRSIDALPISVVIGHMQTEGARWRGQECAPAAGTESAPLCADTCGATFIQNGICNDASLGGTGHCAPCTDCSDCGACV